MNLKGDRIGTVGDWTRAVGCCTPRSLVMLVGTCCGGLGGAAPDLLCGALIFGIAPVRRAALAAVATAEPTAAATASSTVVDDVEGTAACGVLRGDGGCSKPLVKLSGSGSGALKPNRCCKRFGTGRLERKLLVKM